MALINPGFKAPANRDGHLPPGQSVVHTWPVLTYGPTPMIDAGEWTLTIDGEVNTPVTLSWDEFDKLPKSSLDTDIHCVTRWSKLGMGWDGASLDELIKRAGGLSQDANFLIASSYGDYTTNLPVADIIDGKALVATHADDEPLAAEHGGPARLFVPHLYFWKSAKWITRLTFTDADEPGFWEVNGYHNYGDPWREQRYRND